ncbi:RNI-like protein [Calocera viscosa TUFC12733]|uniref:RNI-like protein n=1 Tax=Calocera viscosa (strain TUFC12733) TaxID=1330018 RepID=A0A167QU78_CALVF|nr:RNI-like protein [Calocera viscosa TUFC12733]
MSLRPPPSPNRSPSLTSQSDEDEYDIPDLSLPRGQSSQAPAPWDGDASSRAASLQRTNTLTGKPGTRPLPLANNLPHEILIHILKFVPSHTDLHSSLLVSRQWCQCTVELLWHKPVFTKVSSLFKLISILSLARQPDQATPFDSPREGHPRPHRPLTFPYPVFLRRLNFALLGADYTDSIFSRLSLCTRLERLTLSNCTSLTSPALAYILPQLKHLVALDLTNVSDLNDAALEAIASACTRLQGINLSNCTKITDDGILALATHSHLLRRVKLCGLTEVEDRAFAALASGCPLLIEMDLNGCVGVQDETPRALFLHSRQLRELRLAGCLQVTDNAFPLKPLPSPAPLGAAFQRSLNPATYALPQGTAFDHLRMLDLTSCTGITDDALDRIVSNAPRIRNLVLAKCVGLSQECVDPIGRLGKHLHYLHLGHVAQLTDRSIRALASACTRLRYIDLACCQLLTDMSVFELAQLPKLRRIGLVRVTNLTDNALFALGDRHHTLERIHLSYCEGISVQAVHFLLQRLGRLTHLSLTGVPAFRRPELQQFCRSPPKEFNDAQQRTFCVYSGKGVNDLRKYLASIANTPFPYVLANESDSEASTTPPPDPVQAFNINTPQGGDDGVMGQLEGLSLGITFGSPGEEEDADADLDGDGEDGDADAEDEGTTPLYPHPPLQPQQQHGHGHSHSHPPPRPRGRDDIPRYTFGQTDPTLFDFSYPALPGPSTAGAGAGGSSSLPHAYPGPSGSSASGATLGPPPAAGGGNLHTTSPVQSLSSAPSSLAPTPNTDSFVPSPGPPSAPGSGAGSSSAQHVASSGSAQHVASRLSMHQPGTPDLDLAETGGEDGEERILLGSPLPGDAGPGGAGSGSRRSSMGSASVGATRRRGPLEFLFRRARSREGGPGGAGGEA